MDDLFPYQKTGVAWLKSKRFAILADDMGLGKSAQAITACDEINAKKILVLCPAVARINWAREFDRFSIFNRTKSIIKTKKHNEEAEITVASYDLASAVPKNLVFDVLILDEAHFLKSPEARRTQLVFGKEGLVHRARRVWCISGTPAPNHPGELWPMLFAFGITNLKFDSFIQKFCNSYLYERRRQVTGAKEHMIPVMRELIAPIILRRKKEDVMKELPPITFEHITVEPGLVDLEIQSSMAHWYFPLDKSKQLHELLQKQTTILEAAEEMFPLEGNRGSQMVSVLAESVSTLRRLIGLQKVEPVAELVASELTSKAYGKIVIFAIHRDVIEGLKVALAKFKPMTLYGGTAVETRQRNIDAFQRDPRRKVFIGNIQAAGTAITLTAACDVLFIEQSWVPGENAQAAMRCHRIGQSKPVHVRMVSVADSIDERVVSSLRRKTADLVRLFDEKRAED